MSKRTLGLVLAGLTTGMIGLALTVARLRRASPPSDRETPPFAEVTIPRGPVATDASDEMEDPGASVAEAVAGPGAGLTAKAVDALPDDLSPDVVETLSKLLNETGGREILRNSVANKLRRAGDLRLVTGLTEMAWDGAETP